MSQATARSASPSSDDSPHLRILHMVTRGFGGGSERAITAAMEKEQAWGHEVFFAAGARGLPERGFSAVDRIPLHHLVRNPHPYRDVRALVETRRLLRRLKPDVVHTHESKAGIIGRLAAINLDTVVVHTVHMGSFGSGYPRMLSALFRLAERLMARVTDALVFVGNDLRTQFSKAAIRSRGVEMVIPSRIDLSRFLMSAEDKQALRQSGREELSLNEADVVLVNIGLLEPRKRQVWLLAQLRDSLISNNWKLLLVGTGRQHDTLNSHIQELGLQSHVQLLGFRTDIPRIMASADVLVHASLVEGVAQVMVQASAIGLPVVATEVQGCGDIPDVQIVPSSEAGLTEGIKNALSLAAPTSSGGLEAWAPEAVDAKHRELLTHLNQLRSRTAE